MNNNYDTIFCGGGPLNLLLAISRCKRGERVLIIEQDDVLGGAWKSYMHHDEPFEIGCHIMDRHKRVHAFIVDKMGVEMQAMSPKPVVVSKRKFIPYDYKNNVFYLRKKMGYAKQLKLGKLIYDKDNLSPFKIIPSNYNYPVGGSYYFTQVLLDEVERLGIDILYKKKVQGVNISGGAEIKLLGGDTFTSQQFVISPFTHIESLVVNDAVFEVSYTSQRFRHLLVESDKQWIRPLSYARIMNDPIIHRISPQNTKTDKHYYLIGILNNENTQGDPDTLMPSIHNSLSKLGYIEGHQLTMLRDFKYPLSYMDSLIAEKIRNGIPEIQLNYSTNLIYSLHYHWEEVKTAF